MVIRPYGDGEVVSQFGWGSYGKEPLGKSSADKKRGTSDDAPPFAIQSTAALFATASADPQLLLSASTVTPVIVMSTATTASIAVVDPEGDDTA